MLGSFGACKYKHGGARLTTLPSGSADHLVTVSISKCTQFAPQYDAAPSSDAEQLITGTIMSGSVQPTTIINTSHQFPLASAHN